MVWLHKNKDEFKNAVMYTADKVKMSPAVIEKDYYVTLVLKGLNERLLFIVFKGGTSLSKCYQLMELFLIIRNLLTHI